MSTNLRMRRPMLRWLGKRLATSTIRTSAAIAPHRKGHGVQEVNNVRYSIQFRRAGRETLLASNAARSQQFCSIFADHSLTSRVSA
jgi:hypothetical protein